MSRSFGVRLVDDAAADRDRPVGDVLEPGDHAQRGRLAAAGRPDEHEELAVADASSVRSLTAWTPFVVDLVDLVERDLSHRDPPDVEAGRRRAGRRRGRRRRTASRATWNGTRIGVVRRARCEAEQRARRASRGGTRSRRSETCDVADAAARQRVLERRSAISRAVLVEQRRVPGVAALPHGIVRRASSPHSPSRPSSSPAKIIGTPGVVICRPTPTSCRSREPVTVRKRGVSWLSSSVHECSVDCHGTPARNARIDATVCSPREAAAPGSPSRTGRARTRFVAQPPPDRPQEARVVHRRRASRRRRGRGGSRDRARRRGARRRPRSRTARAAACVEVDVAVSGRSCSRRRSASRRGRSRATSRTTRAIRRAELVASPVRASAACGTPSHDA